MIWARNGRQLQSPPGGNLTVYPIAIANPTPLADLP
jgi:hypothetical protein